MRRLRLSSCRRILGFTRNPSAGERGEGLHNHETPEKPEGFRVFQNSRSPRGGNLACLRASGFPPPLVLCLFFLGSAAVLGAAALVAQGLPLLVTPPGKTEKQKRQS